MIRRHKYRSNKILRRQYIIKLAIYVFLILFIFSLFVYIFNNKTTYIADVTISGIQLINEKEIKNTTFDIITNKYFKIFTKRNILFVPKDTITGILLNAYPMIGSLKIKRDSLRSISIHINERSPDYLYCDYTKSNESNDTKYLLDKNTKKECYFMDNGGFSYSIAPMFTTRVYFEYYFDKDLIEAKFSNADNPIGQKLIKDSELARDSLMNNFFKEFSLTPIAILYRKNGDREIFIDSNTRVLFKGDDQILPILDNLESILTSDVFLEKIDNNIGNINRVSYIDLRFGRKVYYKVDKQYE